MVGERYGKVCRLKPSVQKRAVIADGAQENGGETPSAFGRGKFEVRSQYTYKLASYWRLLLGLSGENRPRRTFDLEDLVGNHDSLVSFRSQIWTRI